MCFQSASFLFLLKKYFWVSLTILLSLFIFSCQRTEVTPTTGDVKVEIKRDDLNGISYAIYTEIYLTANTYVPPVTSGTFQGNVLRVQGLNPGNYVLEVNAGTNWRIFLQVTAGQERTFTIK